MRIRKDDFGGMQQKRSFRPIDQEPRPAVVRIAGNGGIEAERRMGGMEPKLMRAACERQKVDQRTSVFFTQPPPLRARLAPAQSGNLPQPVERMCGDGKVNQAAFGRKPSLQHGSIAFFDAPFTKGSHQ